MEFQIENVRSLSSTNDYLFNLVKDNSVNEGKVILAQEQVLGKGMGSNIWESEVGKNLTFSILIEPDFIRAENQFAITQIISLALVNSLANFIDKEKLKIKWPNDIYFSGNKLAGILIQNIIKGQYISHSIIGVGLNVNQLQFRSDAPNPISLAQITETVFNKDDILTKILNALDENYSRLMLFPATKWLERSYLDNLFRFNTLSDFSEQNQIFSGNITGVDNFGRLMIAKQNGEEKIYGFKEVEFMI